MTATYIISQVFAVLAMLSVGISYQFKNKKIILILCIIYSTCYSLEYLLLGAMAGVAMNFVSVIRNVWFYINARKERKNGIGVFIALYIIIIGLGALTYDGICSLIPTVATLLFTFSVWQDNNKVYRWLSLPISALWITYNICYKSLFGVIAELILLIFEIVGIVRIIREKK